MKIFSTQLQGIFTKITQQEEMNIEDSARLLAQALIAGRSIYLYGAAEMQGVVLEALYGQEPLQGAKMLPTEDLSSISMEDRILIISRFSTDESALLLAKTLQQQGHLVVGISALTKGTESLEQYTDFHIDTKLLYGLIPNEDGVRYGFPSLIVALYSYYCLTFTIKEILQEYEED
ncbi:DUF2529 family protein [Ectobacillus sp. sgz5001026]|uniref:DUF2529 family protein n=1 Tax=Ectobacillus sp. sgz5001026 TaxID=3242473 RepID=UPI0036D3EC3E